MAKHANFSQADKPNSMSTNPDDDPELPPPLGVSEPTKDRFVDQTPYRIPKAPETTPQMRTEYRKRGREKKKRKRRKRQLRNAAALLALLIIPVVWVLYSTRSQRSPETSEDLVVVPATSLQKLLESGDAAKLIKYSDSLENDVLSGILPTQVSALQKRDQIADRLMELDEDVESTNYGVTTKINGLMTLSGFDILNDFDETISAKLLDFSTKHTVSSYPEIRNRANLGIVASRLHDYVQNSTEQNFDQVKKSLAHLLDELTPDIEINPEVRMILQIMALSKRDDHILEFKSLYGAKLKQCADPELRKFGALVFDETIIGPVNFDTLRQDVLVGDRDSIMQLESIVDAISANPIVSVPVFLCAIGVVENLRQLKEDELEDQLVEKLREAIPRIPDDATREQVAKALNDYDTRQNLLGKIIDPLGELTDPENLQEMPMATVIVFFSYGSDNSAKLISSLNNIDSLVTKRVPCLLVCIDASLATDAASEIKAVFPSGKLVGPPKNAKYLAHCPLFSVPYVIILDKERRVVGVNVGMDQIRGDLAALSKR